jgi:predicted dehydrogenase
MQNRKLKGVCIGAGYFSQFQYEAWARIEEVEIVAFCNRDATRAKEITNQFGIQKHYTDYREMFDKESPDFVDIITPPPTHLEICKEAGRHGIHIMVQKPLAPTQEEAAKIVADADKSGVRLMVHENFRFQPWHREIKRLLNEGAIGDQLHSLNFRTRTGEGWGKQAYIPRQPYFRDYPRLLVYETGVHFIDTFRYLAGDISKVSAWLRKLNPVIKGEDCGLLVFEFANGAIGQWDANRFNEPPSGTNARYTFGEFLIEGNKGSIRLSTDGTIMLQNLGEEARVIPYSHERIGFAGDCVYTTQRHFVDRMLDDGDFETSGNDYLKTIKVQEAVYEAAAKGQPVELNKP